MDHSVANFNTRLRTIRIRDLIVGIIIAGIITGTLSLFFETVPTNIPTSAWAEIIYLTLFGTLTAFLLQNVSQKHMSSSAASIILTLEAVVGALFSVVFYNEVLTLQVFVGFVVIFVAVFVSETKLSLLKKDKNLKTKLNKK